MGLFFYDNFPTILEGEYHLVIVDRNFANQFGATPKKQHIKHKKLNQKCGSDGMPDPHFFRYYS